eukprot:SAG11_NODE_18809_length_475_cov_26.265092_1_plen_28_part_10
MYTVVNLVSILPQAVQNIRCEDKNHKIH